MNRGSFMDHLLKHFMNIFGHLNQVKTYFSPGRVNLIGEHIDYNGGLVFPAAINLGTYGLISLRDDRKIRMFSLNFKNTGLIEIDLDHLNYQEDHQWSNYVKGVLFEMLNRNFNIHQGFDLLINGTLPTASGLSSSASLELLIAYMMNDLFSFHMSRKELALLSQYVENHYMGMHCGIMDQLIIACGVKDKALLMKTNTLEIDAVNAHFDGYQWVIMNTNYPRKTTESKYNERRKECQKALVIAKKTYDIHDLCDLSIEELEAIKDDFDLPIIYQRARHAVTEQARTLKAKFAMETQDPHAFATLLNESHASLKTDYEVTGMHLDKLVEGAVRFGAIGSRVTGAGFGGCAIALVPNDYVENFSKHVNDFYKKETHLEADFYFVSFEDGVKKYEI